MTQKPPVGTLDPAADATWQRDVQESSLSKRQQMLITAAAKGQATRLAFIYAQDTSVCADKTVLNTALYEASGAGHLATTRWLLNHGGDAAHMNSRCVISAIQANSGYVVDILLRHGADIAAAEKIIAPWSLLARAVCDRKPEAAKALLLHGCDPYGKAPTGQLLKSRMSALGTDILVEISNRLWLKNVPHVFEGFAAKVPLEQLKRAWQTHEGLTGYQLCAYNGHIDILLARLTANGRMLSKRDLISATPKHPQTILFILGQRNELAKVFKPALWGGDIAAMRAILPYVPAAFRHQIDADVAAWTTAEHQQKLKSQASRDARRLRLPKPPRP